MKNVAIICLSPNKGGMEISSLKLASKLEENVNVTLICKKNSFISLQGKDYLNQNKSDIKEVVFRKTFSINMIFQIRKILKESDIKNIIFFGASELKSLYFSCLGLNINFIMRHATTKTTSKKDIFHKLIYSDVDYHVAISEHLLENIKTIFPLNNKCQLKVVYPSIITSLKENKKLNQVNLLHTGRIIKGKGQLDAIKACEVLYKNNIPFNFIILGTFEEEFEKDFFEVYNKLEYKDSIQLMGFQKDVNAYLSQSDIFLFPSYGEGFCNSYAEALSYGLYCISYDNTTFPEFKSLGFVNSLAKNLDIKDLEKKLLAAVDFIKKDQTFMQKNVQLSEKLFSVESEVNGYLKILR